MSAVAFGSIKKSVTTAGTRVALSATTLVVRQFRIRANTANTGAIYVGGATVASTNGYEMATKDIMEFRDYGGDNTSEIDLANVYIDSSANGEGVTVFYAK